MTVPAEVESFIAGAPVSAHLATSVDDRPHIAPVWYGYREGVLYFITGGRKLANLRRNPRVAVSIEQARDGDVDWNVTLLGRATVHDDTDRIDWASDWIYDKYETDDLDTDESSPNQEPIASDDEIDDERRTNGGESTGDEDDYALVEVAVCSVSWNVYE